MIYFAFEMQPGSKRGPVVLVMILGMDNLERMKQADPFDVLVRQMPLSPALKARRVTDLDIVIAYEDDEDAIADFKARNDLAGLIKWLERGRRIRPGDLAPHVILTRGPKT